MPTTDRPISSRHHAAYALQNDTLLHVSQVKRGLACSCVCAACGERLVAKKGEHRAHHFAHHGQAECIHAAETALHLAAKKALCVLNSIWVPPYRFTKSTRLPSGRDVKTDETLPGIKGGYAPIRSVELEVAFEGVRADAVVQCGRTGSARPLLVEIVVTHDVDSTKRKKLRGIDLPAIAIYLDLDNGLLTPADLAALIAGHRARKQWIFHPNQRQSEERHSQEVQSLDADERRRRYKLKEASARDRMTHNSMREGPSEQSEWNRRAEQYFRRHGEYPSLEVMQHWTRGKF